MDLGISGRVQKSHPGAESLRTLLTHLPVSDQEFQPRLRGCEGYVARECAHVPRSAFDAIHQSVQRNLIRNWGRAEMTTGRASRRSSRCGSPWKNVDDALSRRNRENPRRPEELDGPQRWNCRAKCKKSLGWAVSLSGEKAI